VFNFAQTRLATSDRFSVALPAGPIVTKPKSDKHKEYARHAAHCLNMMTASKDQDARSIQREMAAEWLKLAEAILHPLAPMK
jgi:hypothetical protein